LRNCPITFTHPEEAIALDGIGKGIAKYIFDKLTDQANERGLPPPERRELKKRFYLGFSLNVELTSP